MAKYYNTKVTVDGITFDSRAEARRYQELVLLRRAGEIADLRLQVPFELQPSFKKHGRTIRAINYVADFVYTDLRTGETIVEDVKGMRTKEYSIKKKLFEFKYPDMTIKEIKA